MKRIWKGIPAFICAAVCMIYAFPGAAECSTSGAVADPEKNASFVISYTDDTAGEKPVAGAEFTVYKIADFVQTADGGTVSAHYIPIIDGIAADADANPAAIADAAARAYHSGIPGGGTYVMKTDAGGEAICTGMSLGMYIAVETAPAKDHFASAPFIVTVPQIAYSDDGSAAEWNYDIKAYPKSLPSGNLTIEKKLAGNNAEAEREFHFKVVFEKNARDRTADSYTKKMQGDEISEEDHTASGETPLNYDRNGVKSADTYSYVRSDGTRGVIRSGDAIALKGGQSVTISGIPVGTQYSVEETEADKDGYSTEVKGGRGTVSQGDAGEATFINERSCVPTPSSAVSGTPQKNVRTNGVKTGDSMNALLFICLAGGALAALAAAALTRRKNGKE